MIPPFVDPDWLARHRAEVALVDVRWYLDGRSGRRAYERGHLPGAVYLELTDVLSGEPSEAEGRHPLPSPERFAAGLGQLGIGADDTVIAYDDGGGLIAARLVWLLRVLGQPAALLDGGLAAWTGELDSGPPPRRAAVSATPRPWPEQRLVTIDQLAFDDAVLVDARDRFGGDAVLVDARDRFGGDTVLIDARDRDRFGGGPDPVDPRSGHIPGARSLPASEQLAADGRVLSEAELARRFAAVGIDRHSRVISYCGSGVSACFNLLAMERAGLPAGRLYPGSWSQWSRDPGRPVETAEST